MQVSSVASGPSNPKNLKFVALKLQEIFQTAFDYEKWFRDAFVKLENNLDNCPDAFEHAEYILDRTRDIEGLLEVDLKYISEQLNEGTREVFRRGFYLAVIEKVQNFKKEEKEVFFKLYYPLIEAILPQEHVCLLLKVALEKNL